MYLSHFFILYCDIIYISLASYSVMTSTIQELYDQFINFKKTQEDSEKQCKKLEKEIKHHQDFKEFSRNTSQSVINRMSAFVVIEVFSSFAQSYGYDQDRFRKAIFDPKVANEKLYKQITFQKKSKIYRQITLKMTYEAICEHLQDIFDIDFISIYKAMPKDPDVLWTSHSLTDTNPRSNIFCSIEDSLKKSKKSEK